MNDRKDDLIIGLLIVIIVMQVYGIFFAPSGSTPGQPTGSPTVQTGGGSTPAGG